MFTIWLSRLALKGSLITQELTVGKRNEKQAWEAELTFFSGGELDRSNTRKATLAPKESDQ
jgi:hypothetical protein